MITPWGPDNDGDADADDDDRDEDEPIEIDEPDEIDRPDDIDERVHGIDEPIRGPRMYIFLLLMSLTDRVQCDHRSSRFRSTRL